MIAQTIEAYQLAPKLGVAVCLKELPALLIIHSLTLTRRHYVTR